MPPRIKARSIVALLVALMLFNSDAFEIRRARCQCSLSLQSDLWRQLRGQPTSWLAAGDREGELTDGKEDAMPAVSNHDSGGSFLHRNHSTNNEKQKRRPDRDVGGFDPSEQLQPEREVNVGAPQLRVQERERSVTSILRELAAIQQQGPQKYCILGTRHCSFLHQQIIELLAYALVLSGNHVYTSGAGGTHAATIRGALRAERPDLLTVVLPQSMSKQTKESQDLLKDVEDVITMPQNDDMSLDVASRICNSYLLSQTDQLISFAFHESTTVIEATKEAKELDMLVTVLFLD